MTMNAAAPTATTPAAPEQASVRTTAYDRAASLKASLEDGAPEPAVESSDTPAPAEGAASSAAASDVSATTASPEQDAAAKRAAERLARIQQVRAKERAAEEDRRKRESAKANTGELEKLRARVSELEPLNDVFRDEESLLAYAEKKGMSAEKLVQWMRTRLSDPAAVAERQAQTVEEKLRAEIEAERAERKKLEERLENERQQAELERTQEAKTVAFKTQAKTKTDSHPFTASLQTAYGDDGLIAFANQFVAPLLPQDYSLDELHDHTEQLLDELAPVFRAVFAQTGQYPANGTSQPSPKNGAGQPTTTLSNALASGRESLVEDVPIHKLSREERKRRVLEKLEREP